MRMFCFCSPQVLKEHELWDGGKNVHHSLFAKTTGWDIGTPTEEGKEG